MHHLEGWPEPGPSVGIDYSEIRDLGDRIVGIGRIRTRGKHSGAVTEMAFGTVTDA